MKTIKTIFRNVPIVYKTGGFRFLWFYRKFLKYEIVGRVKELQWLNVRYLNSDIICEWNTTK